MSTADFLGEIITTGNELLSGRIADANARYAAVRLHAAGLKVQVITILGDAAPLFQDTLSRGLSRSRFIIVTGGLGPTEDDITAAAAAEVLHLPLRQDEYLLARLRECFRLRGLPWEERFARLALVPQGACILDPNGAACGFYLNHQGARLYFLPGVPREMRLLFDNYVLPALLLAAAGGEAVCERTLRFFGLHETELEDLFQNLAQDHQGVSVGYYPNFPENHLTLTVRGPKSEALEKKLEAVAQELAAQAGDAFLGGSDDTLEEILGRQLRVRQLTLAVAESCSGGLICHRLTNIPGSSDYFQGGVVTYSNRAKVNLLHVPESTLHTHGAVSGPTAAAMAVGVRDVFGVSYSLAVTGIAGPTGGSPQKPVGTVYLGLAGPQGVKTRHCLFQGSREEIKILTAQTALDWLRRELQ
ncbi:competence/damage-inducible protein A [Desulfobacca acetoxidans]